jgi:peptidoglycan LD-endopeptidase CwlK
MELSKASIKKLAGCDERLHVLAVESAKDTPIEFIITNGFRPVEEQKKLYEQGRSLPGKIITNCDGIKNKSKHNYYPSKAFDFAAIVDGQVTWDEHYYINIGNHIKNTAKHLGINIEYGGDWEKFKDYPHVQLK